MECSKQLTCFTNQILYLIALEPLNIFGIIRCFEAFAMWYKI